MHPISILHSAISFRLIAVSLLTWLLYSSQSIAWQNNPYQPYPNYPAPGYYNPNPNYYVPVNYNPPPRYRQPVNYNPYPQPNYNQGYYYPSQPFPAQIRQAAPYQAPAPEAIKNQPVEQTIIEPAASKPSKSQPGKTSREPSNQSSITTKQDFIEGLLPFIEQENNRILRLRQRAIDIIQHLDSASDSSEQSKVWLKKIAKKYRIKGNPVSDPQAREKLLRKIDIIPASLTLAQAANESAWGRSRFATEANNLFGIWTYDESKGLIPLNRDSDKKHLIRVFDHFGESVAYYMHTLNSHPAYHKLREIRQQQRAEQQLLDGHAMAEGLEKYSARGEQYILLIQDLILKNQWAKLDDAGVSA